MQRDDLLHKTPKKGDTKKVIGVPRVNFKNRGAITDPSGLGKALGDALGLDPRTAADVAAQIKPKSAAEAAREARGIIGGPLEDFGRIALEDGTTVSLRLNPGLARKFVQDSDAPIGITEAEFDSMISQLESEYPDLKISSEGGNLQRGGALNVADKLAVAKAIAMMALYNTGWAVGDAARALAPGAKAYFMREIATPLYGVGSKVYNIVGKLADQLIVKTPVTLVMLTGGSLGYTANVAAKVIEKFNTWGRGTTETLLSDPYAQAAADAAVASSRQIAITGGVGLVVANQIGILPLSVLLAAILFSLKVNLGTGPGRAYVMSSFYTWYIQQDAATKEAIKTNAVAYASAAGSGAAAAASAAGSAAAVLGPALVKAGKRGAAAGKTAFGVIAAAVQANGGTTNAAPVAEAGAATTALQNGTPVAAVVAQQVQQQAVASGETPAGGRKKTAKRSLKRRVTRRRKAPKYLAAPVFGRKGATFAY